ncbi:glycosyltransferase [Cronobacter malonaticus]|uniref:WepH n=1 Tax=Cronobacter sakazakii TaxID=28141 RepID=I1W295_CROSK|nr:glycosyltransferase [Cronobacter malonaticus]AFI60280.1 WepH [Cronobacter sakazakii]CCJ98797.1 glycosyl transferase, family 2 [Cronobacter malonaticus 507]ELY2620020.1 glycosyltransferase [Cronobacter malonaticus]ELY3624760.1 glycosyltransferase [Cronobacter malonaticus]MBF4661007.1 glycosyltransferase [Cronobacter malonaticus]
MGICKITVITLTYNNWRKIHTAILSLAKQIIDPKIDIEYLIVDDGTKDFDAAFVQKLIDDNLRIKTRIIQNNKNVGTVKSFNNAVKNSHGQYIIPLSADDEFFDNEFLNKLIDKFIESNADIVTAKRIPFDENKYFEKHEVLPSLEQIRLFDDQGELLKYILKYGSFISGACTYYRKSFLERMGYFDESYVLLEDYPFLVKSLINGVNIQFLDAIAIKYHLGGVSSVSNRNPLLAKDFRKLYLNISNLPQMNLYWRRRLYYSKVLTTKEKIHLKNIMLYPEQFIILLFTRLKLLRAQDPI